MTMPSSIFERLASLRAQVIRVQQETEVIRNEVAQRTGTSATDLASQLEDALTDCGTLADYLQPLPEHLRDLS
jgi:hypothetical protein